MLLLVVVHSSNTGKRWFLLIAWYGVYKKSTVQKVTAQQFGKRSTKSDVVMCFKHESLMNCSSIEDRLKLPIFHALVLKPCEKSLLNVQIKDLNAISWKHCNGISSISFDHLPMSSFCMWRCFARRKTRY